MLTSMKRTFNSILSSKSGNWHDNLFQPMASGYLGLWNTFDKFWCCTGTGVEFHETKRAIYYYKDNVLFVNRYISSELD